MSISESQPLKQFVRAGAGAGKTYSLTREVVAQALDFQAQHGRWPKMVLTTFTKKATQELKERLLVYCLTEKPQALEFVQSTSHLSITTMHGLFSQFLSQKGSVLKLPSQFKIIDTLKGDYWRKQILKDMVAEKAKWPFLQVFDFRRLVANLKSYESVYWSGAGRPISSVDEMKQVYQQLTEQWADDLASLIDRMAAEVSGEKWLDYLNGLEELKSLLRASSSWQQKAEGGTALLQGLKKPRKSKNTSGLSKHLATELTRFITQLKKWWSEKDYSEVYWQQTVDTYKQFDEFANIFCQRLFDKKIDESSLEANDLEFFTLKILKQYPKVFESFSKEIDGWFIDEFQDTSPLQLQIIDQMVSDRSCYIVGDPQQSIYLFRGSRSEVFFNKQQDMEQKGGRYQFKRDNYRSQAALLEFFNQFFPMIDQSFSEMNAIHPSIDDPCVVISQNLTEDTSVEMANITHQLHDLISQGVRPKDIAILCRTHGDIDRLQKILMNLKFPVISHSSSSFYKRREILDALSIIQFLINPWDDKNLILLMRSPWMALEDQQIVAIIGDGASAYWPLFRNYFEQHPEHQAGAHLLKAFSQRSLWGYSLCLRYLLDELGLFRFSLFVDSTGRREANLWKLVNLVEKNAREPGQSLLQLVKEGASSGDLESLGDAGDASSPVAPDKINLMTIHASKGLQFDHVFVPFLHRKPQETTFESFSFDQQRRCWALRLPLTHYSRFVGGALENLFVSSMKKREAEEALRVFYVALTRAKTKVYLSWSGQPDKKSWAQLISEQLPSLQKMDQVQFDEFSEKSPKAAQMDSSHVELSKPWSDLIEFVDSPEDNKPSVDINNYDSWESLQKSQIQRRRGVIIHQVFEFMKFHGKEKAKQLGAKWLPEMSDQISQAIEFMWSHPEIPFQDILNQGEVEWVYQDEQEGGVKERRIDLWGIHADTLWIVDYKTGNPGNKTDAFLQLSEYEQALKKHLNWPGSVKKVAAYPLHNQVYIK